MPVKYIIPLELIELEEANYHLAIKSVFSNGEEHLWVMDTGASKCVFDKSLTNCYEILPADEGLKVHSAGIGNSMLETTLGVLHEFRMHNFLINSMKVALIDLSHINNLYYHATEKKICGLIGSDFLLENKATINYARLELTLKTAKKALLSFKV